MVKRLDPDIKALRGAVRALEGSSSERMLRANLEFLWGRFISSERMEGIDGVPSEHLQAVLREAV